MPLHNLAQEHFRPEELQNLDQLLDTVEDTLKPKMRNLTPAERKRYSSINEANKLFVNKVFDYCKTQPTLCSPDVDWAEFEADYNDRRGVEVRIHRLNSIIDGLQNLKILHDYDNYQSALFALKTISLPDQAQAAGQNAWTPTNSNAGSPKPKPTKCSPNSSGPMRPSTPSSAKKAPCSPPATKPSNAASVWVP